MQDTDNISLQPMLHFFSNERLKGFHYLKPKNESQSCGDDLLIRDLKNFSYLINCDGVSSSNSPNLSSQKLIQNIDQLLSSTRSQKPNIDKVLQGLSKTNTQFLKKNLATTLNLFCFGPRFNFHIGLGDSSFYLFNSDNQLLFQNWIHNQSKIIENHFQKNIGDDHVLVNCVGIYQPRFEVVLHLPLQKGSKIIMHSDGIEQFFTKESDILSFCKNLYQSQKFNPDFFDNNEDDLSLIFAEVL